MSKFKKLGKTAVALLLATLLLSIVYATYILVDEENFKKTILKEDVAEYIKNNGEKLAWTAYWLAEKYLTQDKREELCTRIIAVSKKRQFIKSTEDKTSYLDVIEDIYCKSSIPITEKKQIKEIASHFLTIEDAIKDLEKISEPNIITKIKDVKFYFELAKKKLEKITSKF